MKIENLKLKIVFFGSSKYSTIVEKKLHEAFKLSAVVTIPDRIIRRKKILTPSPVKEFALENKIPIITTDKLDKSVIGKITEYKPDFLVVADYGLFLPDSLLELPKYAPLNVHHSLLPKYRGPSPAPSAILNDEKVSGVTIIKMGSKVDAGPILAQEKYELKPDETTDSLLTRLNTLGGEIIIPVIEKYLKGEVKEIPQDEAEENYTQHITKQDGFIDLTNPPSTKKLDRMIRAYYPWPGVWSRISLRTDLKKGPKANINEGPSLKIIKFLPEKKIQVEGKKPVSYKDFINGYRETKLIFNLKF